VTQAPVAGFLGWRMVALGFLAQNLAIGLTFGSFGVLIKPVASELQASRGLASLGIAVIMLLMGLSGPVLGILLARYPIRRVMSAGAVLMAVGFALAARADSFPLFLLGYSVIGGAGCAALGVIPASTLASNWFVARAGFAIGLVSIPLFVAVTPPVVAWIVEGCGWRGALYALAAVFVTVLPLLQLVVSRPEDVGQRALGADAAPETARADLPPEPPRPLAAFVRSPWYWGALLAAGLLSCGGIVLMSHLVPFATDRGIPTASAALLLSVNGAFSMAGALLFGHVADRIGPRATLGLIGLVQAACWSGIIFADRFMLFVPFLVGIGLCGGGTHTAFSALLNAAYGRASFANALGLATLLMLPFTFVAAPLAGWIFDSTGSYVIAFQVQIAAFLAAAVVYLVIYRGRAAPA
jgi:predicted MFS family arabinose efflux permease